MRVAIHLFALFAAIGCSKENKKDSDAESDSTGTADSNAVSCTQSNEFNTGPAASCVEFEGLTEDERSKSQSACNDDDPTVLTAKWSSSACKLPDASHYCAFNSDGHPAKIFYGPGWSEANIQKSCETVRGELEKVTVPEAKREPLDSVVPPACDLKPKSGQILTDLRFPTSQWSYIRGYQSLINANRLYVISSNDEESRSGYYLDLSSGKWVKVPRLSGPKRSETGQGIGTYGDGFILGGGNTFRNAVYKEPLSHAFIFENETWRRLDWNLPFPLTSLHRHPPHIVRKDSKIIVYGQTDKTDFAGGVFDESTSSWTRIPDDRRLHGYNERFVFFTDPTLTVVMRTSSNIKKAEYDFETSKWTFLQAPNPNDKPALSTTVNYPGTLLLYGQSSDPANGKVGLCIDNFHRYNVKENNWTTTTTKNQLPKANGSAIALKMIDGGIVGLIGSVDRGLIAWLPDGSDTWTTYQVPLSRGLTALGAWIHQSDDGNVYIVAGNKSKNAENPQLTVHVLRFQPGLSSKEE